MKYPFYWRLKRGLYPCLFSNSFLELMHTRLQVLMHKRKRNAHRALTIAEDAGSGELQTEDTAQVIENSYVIPIHLCVVDQGTYIRTLTAASNAGTHQQTVIPCLKKQNKTHTHTHTYPQTQTNSHEHARTHKHAYKHIHIHAYTHMHTHTHTHTHTHKHTGRFMYRLQ